MPVVASFEDMYEFARREVVDEVYINISYVTGESLRKYVREFETMGITVHLNINVLEGEEGFERQINMIWDSPVVSFAPRFFDYNKMIIKRMIDIAGGLVGMAITVIVGIQMCIRDRERIVTVCEKSGVHTKFVPDYNNIIPTKPYTEDLLGMPVIHIRHVPLLGLGNRLMKRTMDIVGSLLAIILFSPVMLVTVSCV